MEELDETYRLDYISRLEPGLEVGVYDVYFGDVSDPHFAGNDVVRKITQTGIIRLNNSKTAYDRNGYGRGRSKPRIGNSGKMIGLPR